MFKNLKLIQFASHMKRFAVHHIISVNMGTSITLFYIEIDYIIMEQWGLNYQNNS